MNIKQLGNIGIDYSIPTTPCLLSKDYKIIYRNSSIEIHNPLCYLPVSEEFQRANENISYYNAILKDRHYRSIELIGDYRQDNLGNLYFSRRIKGAGKYGSPNLNKKHCFQNIKNNETGLVLGLLDEETAERNYTLTSILHKHGVETEIPEYTYEIDEIFFQQENGDITILPLKEAFECANIPQEKRKQKYVVQVDGLGTNFRLQDIMSSSLLFNDSYKNASIDVASTILLDVIKFLNKEFQIKNTTKKNIIENFDDYILTFLNRLIENVARLHNLGGIHNRLTAHNIGMDGRLIDVDSITGIIEIKDPKYNLSQTEELSMLEGTISSYLMYMAKTFFPSQYELKFNIWRDYYNSNKFKNIKFI
ncbi:hypothetical protein [Bacillus sp. FSL R5-0677]|uniref:hypothetical protein n=1 Tax=Bacillus sp. FSL R5-0677 TaxID=2921581 RepID=UPI0030FAAA30